MKRLLAYLLIVLSLGLTLNLKSYASGSYIAIWGGDYDDKNYWFAPSSEYSCYSSCVYMIFRSDNKKLYRRLIALYKSNNIVSNQPMRLLKKKSLIKSAKKHNFDLEKNFDLVQKVNKTHKKQEVVSQEQKIVTKLVKKSNNQKLDNLKKDVQKVIDSFKKDKKNPTNNSKKITKSVKLTEKKIDKSNRDKIAINPKTFRKVKNLINYKIDKKEVKLSSVEALLNTNNIKPNFGKNLKGRKYSTNEETLNKRIYKYLVQNSEKHNLLNPGDVFQGIINLEILYKVKLYKKKKIIKRYINNTKKGKKWFNMLNEKKVVVSLVQMKESINSIRENFGIEKNETTKNVVNTYDSMSNFLNSDEFTITRTNWLNKKDKEQKKLMEKYISYLNQINKILKDAEKNI
jgi:hypothetical protein